MTTRRLSPEARTVLILNALYVGADALCSVFVGVYLWINSLAFHLVCLHYLTLYAVTPVVFLLAGWYSQARDRLHVYRLGLFMHAVYYASILWLREDSPRYAIALGALLGVTWGLFWAGNNVFNYDVTRNGSREYYFGWLSAVNGASQLVAPLVAGLLVQYLPDNRAGYHVIFAIAALMYLAAIGVSVRVPPDNVPRPYHLRRALFPGKDQRDWRLVMLTSLTLAGAYNLFTFLLALFMFIETGREANVGIFSSFQALASITVAYFIGRAITPRTRKPAMFASVSFLLAAGLLVLTEFNLYTLIVFGFLRSLAGPLFEVPHSSIRYAVIDRCAHDPSQRIEYIAAWEVPLAMGRIAMLGLLIGLHALLGPPAVRIVLFLLCVNRLLSFLIITRTSVVQTQAT